MRSDPESRFGAIVFAIRAQQAGAISIYVNEPKSKARSNPRRDYQDANHSAALNSPMLWKAIFSGTDAIKLLGNFCRGNYFSRNYSFPALETKQLPVRARSARRLTIRLGTNERRLGDITGDTRI
jgi:hypothetical protein